GGVTVPPLVVVSSSLSGRGSVIAPADACSVSSTPTSATPRYVREATLYVRPPLVRMKNGTSTRSTPSESMVSQRYGMTYGAATREAGVAGRTEPAAETRRAV